MKQVFINLRTLRSGNFSGVQRYALEIFSHLSKQLEAIEPPVHMTSGLLGHVWEQVILPRQFKKGLLFSPGNTGPLTVDSQVVTIHDMGPLDHPEWFNRRFADWYHFLVPRLVRRVRRVITDSEFTKTRLLEQTEVTPEKIVVVPLGVDEHFYPRSEKEIRKVRDALGIPTAHYVLSLGSLEPRKNLHRLLQAWEQIQTEIPQEVWLVIAGAKGKPMVFRQVSFDRLPPRVYLTGHVPDEHLPALYSGALAFAYVSVYEGFGLPPLEAMASGTPPLTGNRTSLPEVVGDAGLMVDPYDVEAIAWGLRRFVEDSALREKLRRMGLQRARQYSWERAAELTWKVLQEVAEGG